MGRSLAPLFLAATLSCFAALAAGPENGSREVIPGADKMTSAERDAYRNRGIVGDPARGATIHQGCFGCHGVERYTQPITQVSEGFIDAVLRASGISDMPPASPARFKGRITSLSALRDAVLRRNDFLNPKMTPQEVEDVVAYLNVTYYKFPSR